jgi:hypothetical protein
MVQLSRTNLEDDSLNLCNVDDDYKIILDKNEIIYGEFDFREDLSSLIHFKKYLTKPMMNLPILFIYNDNQFITMMEGKISIENLKKIINCDEVEE